MHGGPRPHERVGDGENFGSPRERGGRGAELLHALKSAPNAYLPYLSARFRSLVHVGLGLVWRELASTPSPHTGDPRKSDSGGAVA